jgi:hypothetical protein
MDTSFTHFSFDMSVFDNYSNFLNRNLEIMEHKTYWEENYKTFVEKALKTYQETGMLGGYDILRYAEKGLLQTSENIIQDVLDWYPITPAYIILRLAKEGKLKLKELNQ